MGLPAPIDRYAYEKKAAMVRGMQLNAVTNNCLIVCFFSTFAIKVEDYAEAVTALTGWNLTVEDIRTIAERVWNLARLFNVREGLTRKDDTLPERLFTLASTKGPSKGQIVDRASFDRMVEEYYQLAGWDRETGVPTQEKLKALGIEV
jgi:aldehyde:ferredoxin oxidoreductase